jgi:DNA-binding NtrC family response regulator
MGGNPEEAPSDGFSLWSLRTRDITRWSQRALNHSEVLGARLIEPPKADAGLVYIRLLDDAQGGQLGKEFARSCPGSPVLYTTAYGVTPGLVAMFVEPHGFVSKPYTPWQLLTAVRNLLNSRK